MTQVETTERFVERDRTEEIHITRYPYTHALCGQARGDKPLKPDHRPTCVVCIDLQVQR